MKSLKLFSLAEYSPSGAVGFERSGTSLERRRIDHHSSSPPALVTGAVVVPQRAQLSKTLPISFP